MAGGLLNIISVGNANVMLTGNPTKTFFKVTYSKYTNFGLQRFRLDYEGSRDLRLTTESTYTFKVKRYADLLMDTYLVVALPDIWSPIYSPSSENSYQWVGYEFRWIENIGMNMISSIEIAAGSTLLQRYTGSYLSAMVERDFTAEKKELFRRMTGNVRELNDPANVHGRDNAYPSAFYTVNPAGAEPSIRGRNVYVPINAWFTLDSRCAFPLVSLQYNELTITVTLRPIQELFQVRDIFDTANYHPYIQPDFNQEAYQMYRFLQTPPDIRIDQRTQSVTGVYKNQSRGWNADVHLLATYCFLSKDESKMFAAEDQVYLVKDVFEYQFNNVTGSKRVKLENSMGMVSSWMWYLQRNDVNLRNEWDNYTNWPYRTLPTNIQFVTTNLPVPKLIYGGSLATMNDPYDNSHNILYGDALYDPSMVLYEGPKINPTTGGPYGGINNGLFFTGDFDSNNQKDILLSMGILFEGDYRENLLERGVYDYIEKYVRTSGSGKDGLYCYNFCLNTNPFDYQPSGAINLSKFKNIELEVSTYLPSIDLSNININTICNDSGDAIAVSNKSGWQIYNYNYNMTIFEERYNVLSFVGGNCAMMYAR